MSTPEIVYVGEAAAKANLAALHELLMDEGIAYLYAPGDADGPKHESATFTIGGYLFIGALEQLIAWVKGHSGASINFGYTNAGAVTVRYLWDAEQ